MTTPVAAVLFDADGVLQTTPPSWRDHLVGLLGPVDPGRADRFVAEIAAAERPTLTGEADFADRLAEVLSRWGVQRPVPEVLDLWNEIDVDQAMIGAVCNLKRGGVRCGLATNQHAQRAAYMQRTLGYERVFDSRIYSCDVGFAKPDPAFFAYAAQQLGAEPGQALVIDDSADNVAGGRAAGFRAEWFATGGGLPELERILDMHGLS